MGALLLTLYQSVQLNFYNYDDDHYAYPYVQTHRRFHEFVKQVERFGSQRTIPRTGRSGRLGAREE